MTRRGSKERHDGGKQFQPEKLYSEAQLVLDVYTDWGGGLGRGRGSLEGSKKKESDIAYRNNYVFTRRRRGRDTRKD